MSYGNERLTLELRDSRISAEGEIGREEVANVLREEIRRTTPLLRNVFLLRDAEQRPMLEAAETLGISLAAAKSRLYGRDWNPAAACGGIMARSAQRP